MLTARAIGGQPTPSSETSEVRWVPPAQLAEFRMDPSMRLRVQHYTERRGQPLHRLERDPARRWACDRPWRWCSAVELAGDAVGRGRELWCRPGQRAGDEVLGAVAGADVGQALLDRHALSVGAGGHVAVDQRVGQVAWSRLELAGQVVGETSTAASMKAQEWCATRRHNRASACSTSRRYRAPSSGWKPVTSSGGRVADVVQHRGGGQQVGVIAEDRGQGPGGRRRRPWTCAQRRGSGSSRRVRAMSELSRCRSCLLTLSGWCRTFTGMAGPSLDVLKTSHCRNRIMVIAPGVGAGL